jgi:hypothetical protein
VGRRDGGTEGAGRAGETDSEEGLTSTERRVIMTAGWREEGGGMEAPLHRSAPPASGKQSGPAAFRLWGLDSASFRLGDLIARPLGFRGLIARSLVFRGFLVMQLVLFCILIELKPCLHKELPMIIVWEIRLMLLVLSLGCYLARKRIDLM